MANHAPDQTVVTVHGIWTEGRWQEVVAPVLYPHFEPRSKKYRSYRHLGPLDLVFEPWVLFPGLALWALGAFAWPIRYEWLVVSLVLVLLLAHLVVPWRLSKTVTEFIDDADAQLLSGRVHLIAHSLGSYITCTALQQEDPWHLDRVVLTGCVVTPKFDWAAIVNGDPKKVYAVRNEVAGLDLVAAFASVLGWRLAGFGRAGQVGFSAGAVTETVSSPGAASSFSQSGHVISYVSARKGHSGVLKVTYVKNYWLPFFWGIDPHEFRQFLDACFDLATDIRNAGSPDRPAPNSPLETSLAAFMARPWSWAGGNNLAVFLANAGRPLSASGQQVAAIGICIAVGRAERALQAKIEKWRADAVARQSYESPDFDEAIRALDPRVAVIRAHTGAVLLGVR